VQYSTKIVEAHQFEFTNDLLKNGEVINYFRYSEHFYLTGMAIAFNTLN